MPCSASGSCSWNGASIYLSTCLSACLSVCLPACLSVCLCVYLQAWKRSNSARLPQFLNLTTSKTKQFCETSSIFELDNIKNAAIQVRTCGVFNILTSTCASRHNGVQFFISHLPSGLHTRRFSEPTFRPSGATNHWKNAVFRDFPTFSRAWIFFLLRLSLSSSLLLADSSHLCFSSVHIVGNLTSKLPSARKLSIMAALSAWTSTLPSLIIFLQLPRRQLEDGSSSELHLQPLLRPSLGWHFDQDKHCEEQHQPRLARRGRSLLHCAQPGAGTAGPAGMDISMESVVNQGKPWQTYKNKSISYHLIIMLHCVHICESHSSSSPNWFIVMDQHFVLPKGSS